MNTSNTIGDRIKLARTIKGYTQEELGNLIEISQKQMSKYEVNRANPTIETIIKICKELDISADWLILGERENEPKRPEIKFYEKITHPQFEIVKMLQQDVDIKLQYEIMQVVKTYITIVKTGLEKAKQDGIDIEPIIEEERRKSQNQEL